MTTPVPTPTPRAERLGVSAAEIAAGLGHDHLGAEHLMLALLRDPAAVPTQVLARFADPAAVEAALLEFLASDGYRTPSRDVLLPDGTVRPG